MHLRASDWENVASQTTKICSENVFFHKTKLLVQRKNRELDSFLERKGIRECFNDEDWGEIFTDESINFKDYVEYEKKHTFFYKRELVKKSLRIPTMK